MSANLIERHIFDSYLTTRLLGKVPISVKSYNSPLFAKVIFLILGLGSISWLGFDTFAKYEQIQQLERANDLLSQEKYNEAIAFFDNLLQTQIKPKHLLWINRGYAFSHLNQHKQMLESCSNATSANPQSASAWNCQGEALYHLNQYEAALKAFDKAISINRQEIVFWLNKSRVLADLQQYDRAIAASEQAIKLGNKSQSQNPNLNRNLAIAYNQKGQALLKIDRYQQALIAFDRSLEYSPDDLWAQQGKGIAFYQLAQHKKAIKVFEQLLQRDLTQEQQASFWLYKGINLCQIPNFAAADQAFKKVLQLTNESQSRKIAQAGCGIR